MSVKSVLIAHTSWPVRNEIPAYFFYFFLFFALYISFYFLFHHIFLCYINLLIQQMLIEQLLCATPLCTVLTTRFTHSKHMWSVIHLWFFFFLTKQPQLQILHLFSFSEERSVWKEINHSPQSALTELCHHSVDFGQVI